MDTIHIILQWFKDQNWFVLSFAIVGGLNVIVAGARVMGWTQLAEFCGKLEDAIQAMVNAALRKKEDKPAAGDGEVKKL